MTTGILLIDGARNTYLLDAESIRLLIGIGKLKPGDIRRNANMKALNENIKAYMKGTYTNVDEMGVNE